MQNPSAAPIILASTSRYRRGLLDRFLNEYEVVAPGVDEQTVSADDPLTLAASLARSKAEAVSSQYRDAVIIGADQVAVLDSAIIGKPGGHAKAVEQLMAASGKTLQFLTAVCVLDPHGRKRYEHIDETTVRF
ncbi:MAG: Maf family protein, partial [Woeseia sp.]